MAGPYLIGDGMLERLRALIRARAGAGSGESSGIGRQTLAVVQCTSATAAGTTDVLKQCYPASVIAPAADSALPVTAEEGADVLLSLVDVNGAAATPTAGAVYLCILAGDTPDDGNSVVTGRPRAFGIAPSSGLTYDCINAPAIEILGGSNGTWYTYGIDSTTAPSSGQELVIPAAGKYEITLCGHINGEMNTGAPGALRLRIWDSVAGAAILAADNHSGTTATNEWVAATFGANNVTQSNIVSVTFFFIASGGERLSVQMKSDTGTWWFRTFGSVSSTPDGTMRYLKVG